MKKIFLAIIIIISSNLKSQNTNLLNLPKYDKQWYHFGFTLGLMNTNLKIDYQQNLSLKNISAMEEYEEADEFHHSQKCLCQSSSKKISKKIFHGFCIIFQI